MELGLVVGQARGVGGLGSGDLRAFRDQLMQGAEDGEGHVLAVGVEGEKAVAHAAGCRELAVFDLEHVYEAVGVDVVEAVARRHVGGAVAEERRQVRVLAVEVDQVGCEAALLEEEARPRQVADPGARLLRPGVVAVKPLPEGPEGQAGRLADQGLVRRLVDHDPVDPVQELRVRGRLERRRGPGPGCG